MAVPAGLVAFTADIELQCPYGAAPDCHPVLGEYFLKAVHCVGLRAGLQFANDHGTR